MRACTQHDAIAARGDNNEFASAQSANVPGADGGSSVCGLSLVQTTPAGVSSLAGRRLFRREDIEQFCTEARERIRAGYTTPQLCAWFGVSKPGIQRRLQDYGIKIHEERLDALRQAVKQHGGNWHAVAAQIGTTPKRARLRAYHNDIYVSNIRWTMPRIAKLAEYASEHGLEAAAKHEGLSVRTIRWALQRGHYKAHTVWRRTK